MRKHPAAPSLTLGFEPFPKEPLCEEKDSKRGRGRLPSATHERGTPPDIILAVRNTMGSIDLDPASNRIANTYIQAEKYYTRSEDGLLKAWSGNVFLHPPEGVFGKMSRARYWWYKLALEYGERRVHQAIFLGSSLELLQTTQSRPITPCYPTNFPLCIPKKRFSFMRWSKSKNAFVRRTQAYAGFLAFLPPLNPKERELALFGFQEQFAQFGAVINL